MLHNLKHNHVLHQTNVLAVLETVEVPYVRPEKQAQLERISTDFWRIKLTYGFKDEPDLLAALERCRSSGLNCHPMETTYFLSRSNVTHSTTHQIAPWREKLFAAMARNAGSAAEYLQLPNNAVVVLGSRVAI